MILEKLYDREKRQLEITNYHLIENKIEQLDILNNQNPKRDLASKIKSLVPSEIFISLWTESEISSRRQIIKTFTHKNNWKFLDSPKIKDFIDAFNFVFKKQPFSISNLFTLYSIISAHGIATSDKLKDKEMYRSEPVYIGKEIIGTNAYQGFRAKQISVALTNLTDYLNNSNDNIYLKAIVGHIYFEIIHPYYDYNGRTGRFIPLWLFNNHHQAHNMLYFATAVGNYKDQYLSLFNKYINRKTYQINLDRLVSKILDLLILNQKQYLWIKKLENKFLDKVNKSFSNIQKDFIWRLMIKSELAMSNNSWFKLTKEDYDFIEKEMGAQHFSNNVQILYQNQIINISSDRPRKYKLNNYQCFGLFKLWAKDN